MELDRAGELVLSGHAFWLSSAHQLPAGHAWQSVPPAPSKYPSAQTQDSIESDWTELEACVGHCTTDDPPGQYEPATHAEQAPPFGPANPGWHAQSDTLELPAPDWELAGHAISIPLSQKPLTGHTLHGPPGFPWYPGLQMQSDNVSLPTTELLSAGQLVTLSPPGHHIPTAQGLQESPLGPAYPALHTQSVMTEAPTANVAAFTGHAFSTACEHHFPTLHSVHGPPGGP
eukprot:30878-Rhodomonas_salina.1